MKRHRNYCIWDNVTSEYLYKYRPGAFEWSSCYYEGTEDIKIGSDIPHLFTSKKEAEKAVKHLEGSFKTSDPDCELDFKIAVATRHECVIIKGE